MGFVPGTSKTKVVPEGNGYQARYYDADLGLWFDLGDPRPTEEAARALVATFNLCPGCNNPPSNMERLTGRCAKDGLPLDQPRGGVHLDLPPAQES